MSVQIAHFPLRGGLDLQSPMLEVRPGTAALMHNFEVATTGGYVRAGGYERFDGQPRPSSVSDAVLKSEYRAAIQPVPGSGPIRGVAIYDGKVYACRDTDTDGAKIFASSNDGWQEVVTPARNGGGRYEFVTYNFTGSPDDKALYGVDGVNPPFEIKGATFTEITVTGMNERFPEHIAAHKNHLFLSYPGGSVQHSGIGDPFNWDAATGGAGEVAQGDEITGLMPAMEDALVIFSRNITKVLYGSSSADWQAKSPGLQSDGSGALPHTIQLIGEPLFLDDIGLRNFSATNAYGNFKTGTLSQIVEPLIQSMLKTAVASVAMRDKSQYRLFDNKGRVLCLTSSGGKMLGYGLCRYFETPTCAYSGEGSNGNELAVFGASNGYVYEMERGNTYDGEPIPASLRLNFHIASSPTTQKRWRKAVVDITTETDVRIYTQANFNFGHPDVAASRVTELDGITQTGGVWDADDWGEFVWDGQHLAEATTDIVGSGHSMAMTLYSQDDAPSFTLNGMVIHYSPRGLKR